MKHFWLYVAALLWSKQACRACLLLSAICVVCGCSRDSEKREPALQAEPVAVVSARVPIPPKGGSTAVAYMVLRSALPRDAQIVHLSSPVAGSVEVHRHIYENGMHKMRPVAHAIIPSGGELRLEPGGYHLMLLDLSRPLELGEFVTIVFELDDGTELSTRAEVTPRR